MTIQRVETGAPASARRSYSRLVSGAAMLCLAFLQYPLLAQWQTNGGTIYYNGGSVGIGTSTPSSSLHVFGSAANNPSNISSGFITVGNPGGWISGDTTGIVFKNSWEAPAIKTAIVAVHNGYWSQADLRFALNSAADASNVNPATDAKMIIKNNGNVGIGTTNPQHLLHVAGTIGAEEILVTSTGADYVFQPGYRLRPLSEVAKYIEANHHLPDIPSADEVKQKGMGVGEMEAKLLAKIEELTLHMIQADERNNRLEEHNQDLRDRIAHLEAQAAR